MCPTYKTAFQLFLHDRPLRSTSWAIFGRLPFVPLIPISIPFWNQNSNIPSPHMGLRRWLKESCRMLCCRRPYADIDSEKNSTFTDEYSHIPPQLPPVEYHYLFPQLEWPEIEGDYGRRLFREMGEAEATRRGRRGRSAGGRRSQFMEGFSP